MDIPIIAIRSVHIKVVRAVEKYQKIIKSNMTSEFSAYIALIDEVFDISRCKCKIETSQCTCIPVDKIPEHAKKFIIDQRKSRKLTIGHATEVPERGTDSEMCTENEITFSGSEYVPHLSSADSLESEDKEPEPSTSANITQYTRGPTLTNIATECDRYGYSDRGASAFVTAVLRDYNVRDSFGQPIIVDRNKIRRERQKLREEKIKQRKDPTVVKAFSFDSKKDQTFAPILKDGISHPRNIKETHIVILQQPGSEYIGHVVSPEGSNAEDKANILLEFFNSRNIALNNLIGVSCDGEVTNTGHLHGIIRNIELRLKQPLHWFICLIHFNELPFRHLFSKIDGETTGPITSAGTIGKAITDCETKPVN